MCERGTWGRGVCKKKIVIIRGTTRGKDECRYNERLNTKTGGSKTPRIHRVVWFRGPSPSSHTAGNCRPGRTHMNDLYVCVFIMNQ